ncbi:MAG: hypothetical protein MR963_01295 [Bacteroidales bacterium]|nr:hypothetical protein [Bacteroidales bacterium]
MINAIIVLILLYLVFRFLTTWFIPKMTRRNIKRFQEKFKRENPDIFKSRNNKNQDLEQ